MSVRAILSRTWSLQGSSIAGIRISSESNLVAILVPILVAMVVLVINLNCMTMLRDMRPGSLLGNHLLLAVAAERMGEQVKCYTALQRASEASRRRADNFRANSSVTRGAVRRLSCSSILVCARPAPVQKMAYLTCGAGPIGIWRDPSSRLRIKRRDGIHASE